MQKTLSLDQSMAEYERKKRFPEVFRNSMMIDVEDNKLAKLGDRVDPFQKEDFEKLDPCMKWLAGRGEKPAKRRYWIQRARGHSKTSDLAMEITWMLWASKKRVEGIVAADDKDQAKLLRNQMVKIAQNNPWLMQYLDYQNKVVLNKLNGSALHIMSSDASSSWGITPEFVIADEFTHWTQSDFWYSVASSFEKKAGMLIIACNAGMGRDWKWDTKELARMSPQWHYLARPGCTASWIAEESLEQQRAMLPINEFSRLWLNEWQETGGEFVTMEEVLKCRDESLKMHSKTQADGWKYVASIDYAEKHDRTVGVVCHQEGRTIYVDRMDVICPKINKASTRIEWVENWIENVDRDFGGSFGEVHFIIDEYQLLNTKQRLEDKVQIEPFQFKSGIGNFKLGMALRQAIIHESIKWYKGCGEIVNSNGEVLTQRDDNLEIELASLVVKQYANSARWRFDHLQDNVHHDDRSYALGAAVLYIVERDGFDLWDFVAPEQYM